MQERSEVPYGHASMFTAPRKLRNWNETNRENICVKKSWNTSMKEQRDVISSTSMK